MRKLSGAAWWQPGSHRSSAVGRIIAAGIGALVLAGVTGASAAAALRSDDGSSVPTDVQAAVDAQFSAGKCATKSAAAPIEDQLTAMGYSDWVVQMRLGTEKAPCVSAGIDAQSKTVVLIPAMGPDVSSAMKAVADELLSNCMDAERATAFVLSAIQPLGYDASIHTDGPVAYPADRAADAKRQLAQGCYLYSGGGTEPDGTPIIYLGGSQN